MVVCPFLPSFICCYHAFCDGVTETTYVSLCVTIFKEMEATQVSISQTTPVCLL